MNVDTAERPAAHSPSRGSALRAMTAAASGATARLPPLAAPVGQRRAAWWSRRLRGLTAAVRRARRRLADDEQRIRAVRDSVGALVGSRVLVWAAGSGTMAVLGFGPLRKAFDPRGITSGFGRVGDLLAGPAARWDAVWYLVIAQRGYHLDLGSITAPRAAFFPLYPLGLRAVASLGAPPVLAGVLLSLAALGVALYCIHRLTTLELSRLVPASLSGREGADVARLAVALTAFAPMAFFLSAVYSESLFLALSAGLFLAARRGRWALVGLLAALAGATRSAGAVLVVPALILYLYGPREDRAPDRPPARRSWPAAASARGRSRAVVRAVACMRPRYRARGDLLWLALAPAGMGLFMLYAALSGGDALLPLQAQGLWGRHFAGPFAGAWDGMKAAFEGARQLLSFQTRHVYFPTGADSPSVAAGHNLLLAGFLLAALPALVGVLRRLPFAYGAYLIGALAMALSYPVAAQPLMSLPRFELVLFPLTMWLAGWLSGRPRARRALPLCFALLLCLFTAQFATWHWVA